MKGQIEKRGERVYRLRWYTGRVDGKRQYGSKTVRGTKRDAQKALREVLGRQDRGLAVPTRVPTVAEFAAAWEQGEAAAKLRPRTLRSYQHTLGKHVLPVLGELQLGAVHTARIEADVVRPLREAGKIRTAQLAVVALSKLYRSALKDPALGLVGNPCAGVEVGSGECRDVDPLDAGERAAFRKAIAGTPYEAFFLLLMGTGLRPSEARALGWEAVDLAAGELRVERTVDDRGAFHPPKTKKSRRVVPIPASVRPTLAKLHLAQGRPREGLVFHRFGELLRLEPLLHNHFRPALLRAGVAPSRAAELRIYDLRHGFATAALEAGADVRTVADLLGHSTTKMVLNVYQHPTDDRKRDTAERIGSTLFGAAEGA